MNSAQAIENCRSMSIAARSNLMVALSANAAINRLTSS